MDTNGKRSKLHASKGMLERVLLTSFKRKVECCIILFVCAGKERQNEKEWGVRDFDNEPSTRIRGSEGVASLRRNYNGKVPNGVTVSCSVLKGLTCILVAA